MIELEQGVFSMARSRGALWRGEVEARVERLRAQAATFGAAFAPGTGAQFFQQHVIDSLDEADRIRTEPQSPASWWSGALIEDAWRHIRHAEESLVAVTADLASLRQHATRALVRAKEKLPADDAHVAAVTAADRLGDDQALRGALLALLDVVNTESAQRHQRQRGLRNRLRILTIALGLGALAAMAVGMWWWTGVPDGLVAVPSGITGGTWLTLAVIAGAAGALFSAIPSLALGSAQASSFDTTAQQALLKVVVGAWSAPLGLIAVTAGLGAETSAEGTTPNGTLAGFLMMAALFGAAQEALTRFADKKAEDTSPNP